MHEIKLVSRILTVERVFCGIFLATLTNAALAGEARVSAQTVYSDQVTLPPKIRIVCNANKATCFRLRRTSPPDRGPKARLVRSSPEGEARSDALTLPHRHGPLYALVMAKGHLILVEEWYRAKESDYAGSINSRELELLGHWTLGDIVRTSGATQSSVDMSAKAGRWLSDTPYLSESG